jgi:hypothetical protein
MTHTTSDLLKIITRRIVTIRTHKGRAIRPVRVIAQREPHPLVWKSGSCRGLDLGITASVLAVALCAALGVLRLAMQPGLGPNLSIHGRVTGQAALHIRASPGPVAKHALSFHIGVGGKPL